MKLFGFKIERVKDEKEERADSQGMPKEKTFAIPQNDDGAVTIQSGSFYGMFVDLEGATRNEVELINKYREIALQPELESAIDDVINEAIIQDDDGEIVTLDMDNVDQTEAIKKKIEEAFKYILKLINWKQTAHEIFRRWYIDGRLFYHIVLNDNNTKSGIQQIRYVDPRRIRKIREIMRKKDPRTGIDIIASTREYFVYNDRGIVGDFSHIGARIALDAMAYVTSGLVDTKKNQVLSYLHKAIKPLNNLRMLEDSMVIYRLARAPERRLFYIDTGTLPATKATQYVTDIMNKYRNKLVYDATTGEIRDDRRFHSMWEDYWLPRREGGKGTEVDTLSGAENLGNIQDIEYMLRKLYKALGVPLSRLEPSTGFSLGRTTEITRDELKFMKFIDKIRAKFSTLFDQLLRIQLVTTGVCNDAEWEEIREGLKYNFEEDNNFKELKDTELMRERLVTLAQADPYVGKYFSHEYIMLEILHFTEEEAKKMQKQIDKETEEGLHQDMMAGAQGLNTVVGAPGGGAPQQATPVGQQAAGQTGVGGDEKPPKNPLDSAFQTFR